MYCQSCGKTVTPGLTYCNHCGVRLGEAKRDTVNKSSDIKPESLLFSMGATFVFGLIAIMGLMAALKYVFNQPENMGLIIFFTLLSFVVMLAVEGVFTWMLLSRRRDAREAKDTGRRGEHATNELGEAKARALPDPLLSVTEHTTRTLETVDGERQPG